MKSIQKVFAMNEFLNDKVRLTAHKIKCFVTPFFCMAILVVLPGASIEKEAERPIFCVSPNVPTGDCPTHYSTSFQASSYGTLKVLGTTWNLCSGYKMFVEVVINGTTEATWFIDANSSEFDSWTHYYGDNITISAYVYPGTYPAPSCPNTPNRGRVEYW